MTVPAPPIAYFAKCWKCQSLAMPSVPATYICIGPITMRLANLTARSCKGLNSIDGPCRAGVNCGMPRSPCHRAVAVAPQRSADLVATTGDHSGWGAGHGSRVGRPQAIDQMTCCFVYPGFGLKLWLAFRADGRGVRTARAEAATGRQIARVRRFALQGERVGDPATANAGYGRQQRTRIGMAGRGE